ncbi:unnamed protein product [Tuber melanosporum]|uniref:(Perigord truffle) hypothetical protein n=1 Tax=Tuber melanosporum (strain Mel28) TaxID=656061 RepID=D5GN52_TUBMM|nr:uncharacterized protein GSTUM_00011094001 [Tuber melanosporum]CAZ85945.1 unnamed protein product [Tuber melanosporum]
MRHPNTPGISRAHAPDLRIKIPKVGYGGQDGGSIISSTLASSWSVNSSSASLNRFSESTLTITEFHTDNSKPRKVDSCVPMLTLNKVILWQKKSFSDTISGIKSSFKARFLGGAKKDGRDEEGLQKICYSLVNLPDKEISTNMGHTVFKRQSLTLLVKALRNKQFELILPSIPMTSRGLESVLAGDAEEQGHGGSFERFISMLPESCRDISEKASPLGLVPKLLPYGEISANARYIASCFWTWLCIIDDLTETLTGEAWDKAESDLLRIFSEDFQDLPSSPSSTTTTTATTACSPPAPISDIVKVSTALRTVIDETSLHEFPTIINGSSSSSSASNHMNDDHLWRPIFREAVREVIMGFRAERPLLGKNSASKIDLTEWMRVRIITISVRPFMIITRASLGLDPTLSPFGNPLAADYQDLLLTSKKSNRNNLAKVECLLQLIMGLQNDIIGWEKDHKTKTPLNTVEILIKDGKKPTRALAQVIAIHNKLVEHLAKYGDRAWSDTFDLPPLTPLPGQFMNHNHHHHHHHHGDVIGGNQVFTVQLPPVSSGGSSSSSVGGGSLRVLANHFSTTSVSSWSVASSLRAGGDGVGDNRDSLLSTRRPGTGCSATAGTSSENLRKYLELAVGFSTGMASWMVDSRRYVV